MEAVFIDPIGQIDVFLRKTVTLLASVKGIEIDPTIFYEFPVRLNPVPPA